MALVEKPIPDLFHEPETVLDRPSFDVIENSLKIHLLPHETLRAFRQSFTLTTHDAPM